MLPLQEASRAFSRALARAGSSMAAKMAMMAITTSNSIKVKLRLLCIVVRAPLAVRPGEPTGPPRLLPYH